MKERILYLAEKGYISTNDRKKLLDKSEKIVGIAALLRKNSIKCLIANLNKLVEN